MFFSRTYVGSRSKEISIKLIGYEFFDNDIRTVSTTSSLELESRHTRVAYAVRCSSMLTRELQARGGSFVRLRRAIDYFSFSLVSKY